MGNVVEIIIKQSGQGNAISSTVKELGGLDSAASNSIGTLGRFGGALANMATVAGGIVVANIFGKIAQGISSVVSTGLDAVGSNQQLETSLKSLLTANNMYQETTETMTVAVGNLVEMQSEAAAKSDDLAFKQKKLTAEINTQNASIQEQRQRIMQMADGLDKNQQVARLQEMEIALEGMNRELSDTVTEQGKLNNVTQEYETVSKTTLKTVMSQTDAFKLASSQTQDLLDFVSKLAVTSPFETETVEDVTKYAIAAGMGVEATKEFIPAFLDLAGAVGISSDSLGFAADQLFQVKKVGKLTEIDLRQLRRIGIDLSKVIGVEMGMSVEEFNAKAATTPEIFDELFDAVTRFSQNTFAGTSAEMATSVKGLQSTISDIFVIGSRTFMRPLVDAVTPAISGIIGKLSDFVLGGDLATIGQQVADSIASGISTASSVFNIAKVLGIEAALATVGQMIENAWPGIAEKLTGWGTQFWGFIDTTVTPMAEVAFTNLTNYIGGLIASYWPIIQTQLFTWRDQFFSWVAELYPQIPTFLTELVNNISAFLRDNWPTIQATLAEWATKFWEWANLVVSNAGTALAGILAALTAWSTSSEAQTSLNTMGQELGRAIQRGLEFLFENQEEAARILLKLTGGLLAAVAVIAGNLIIIGGQIVAGIISGILEAMGVDLQPALFSELQGILQRLAEDSMTIIREVAKKIVRALADAVRTALNSDLGKAFTGVITIIKGEFGEALSYLTDDILPLLVEGFEFVTEGVKNFISSIKEAANTLADMAIPDWLQMHSPPPLATALNMSADAANQTAQAISGMGNAMAGINPKQFLDAMDVGGTMHELNASNVNDLKDIFKLNSRAVMDILGSGGGKGELSALLGQQAQIWNVPPQFAQQIAEANGLFDQLIDKYGEFARATRLENLGRLTQMAASFSGLGSTFAGMLEEQMAGGEEAKKTVEAYQAAINKLTASEGANQEAIDKKQLAIEKANEALGFGERQMAIYQQELDALMQDEEGNALQIEKKVLQMDKLTESMDAQSKQLLTLQSELNKLTGDMEKNQQAVKATEESYKALQVQAFDLFSGNQTDSQRISSELATIALLEDFLKSGAESFLIPADAVSQAAGITGILYDQISGQQELNRLLEEQAEREALITAQKEAQQKLDFLKSQLDLIKLGRELGGDIFQGMTFGLDASIEDLLAATNAVTQAMVNQIDEDLGIASPSKVLFDKFKKQVGGGMVEGLLAVKPMIQGAIQPMLDPLLNGAAAAGRVVNNYFNQTVNTQADQSSVIGDFRTMQLMAGS